MEEIHLFLRNYMLLVTQFLAALTGIIYLLKLKNDYWKWFSVYLIIIFIQEYFWRNNPSIDTEYLIYYYVFFGIPLQYIFLYWLYALKSLNNNKLFLTSSLIYITTIGIVACYKEPVEIYSLSINIGTFILIGLLILEFIKQIKTDNILLFKENKMFYVNLGLILFYIGSYPFQVFGKELSENQEAIWGFYYSYTLIANCIMYLLFAASFIWGKTRS